MEGVEVVVVDVDVDVDADEEEAVVEADEDCVDELEAAEVDVAPLEVFVDVVDVDKVLDELLLEELA